MALGFSIMVDFRHVKNVLVVNMNISLSNYICIHVKEFQQCLRQKSQRAIEANETISVESPYLRGMPHLTHSPRVLSGTSLNKLYVYLAPLNS